MRLLSEIDVSGRRVFVRADLDVPTREARKTGVERGNGSEDLEVATRLTNLKPTVDWLMSHGAKQIIIAGHVDRPQKPDPALSTKNLLPHLEAILGQKIAFNRDVILSDSEEPLRSFGKPQDDMREQKLILLENLRFWSGEVANDGEFAKKLASLADIYINEAFGNCHRNHASMVALPGILPAAAGLHLEQEVNVLSNLLSASQRPFIALVGGAKIETKVPVIENLAKVADKVLVGGEIAKEISNIKYQISNRGKVVVATVTDNGKDIDGDSIEKFKRIIGGAKTIIWNGPLGLIEKGFTKATTEIAKAICERAAYSVVGGGDTTHFLAANNLLSKFSFVSAGGGAMLEFLSGKKLPGIMALE